MSFVFNIVDFRPKLSRYIIPDDFILTMVQSNVPFMHEKKDFFFIFLFLDHDLLQADLEL